MSSSIEKDLATLCCPGCHGSLRLGDEHAPDTGDVHYKCTNCDQRFPIVDDVPRMLLSPMREALLGEGRASGTDKQQIQTALSFGFEWSRFPEMYDEWEQSFLMYMQPHAPEFFRGKKVLDAGCGNGRFAYYAARYGAEVWAID